jgi:hypothetical protein
MAERPCMGSFWSERWTDIFNCLYQPRRHATDWNSQVFSPSNKLHREVGRATDLSAPLYNNYLEDFLITTSQLPWPLVSRCNDRVLFSETCTGKVTRKTCKSRHSENDTKRQKHSKFDLHNKTYSGSIYNCTVNRTDATKSCLYIFLIWCNAYNQEVAKSIRLTVQL